MTAYFLTLLRLFYEFAKVGLFAIGGGLAPLPFLFDMADTLGWFPAADDSHMIAVGGGTPRAPPPSRPSTWPRPRRPACSLRSPRPTSSTAPSLSYYSTPACAAASCAA